VRDGRIAVSENNEDKLESFDFDFDSFGSENPPSPLEGASSSVDLGNELGAMADGVSPDNPFLDGAATGEIGVPEQTGETLSEAAEEEKPVVGKKDKKVKPPKEKKPAGEHLPRDLGTVLCLAFSIFLLVSLLLLNVTAFLCRPSGGSILQTLCFIGAFDIVGLAAAAVPILFYKFPKERTLSNVLLGVSAVAMFSGVLVLLTEFYRYSFILKP
jgi:hypothetical protein